MAVQEFDIFSGQNAELVLELFKYVGKEFPQEVAKTANIIAGEVILDWAEEAEAVSSWGRRYASTLTMEPMRTDGKGGKVRVYADEDHPNYLFVQMMEFGVKSWSIRDALMAGKAAQRNIGKYGKAFVRVPFRHRTPSTTKPTSLFAGVMPEDIYKMAKNKKNVGSQFGNLAQLRRFGDSIHGQYFTFRTVTKDSEGWKHPGKTKTPVFEKVKSRVEDMIAGAIKNLISNFEKKLKEHYS